MRAFVFVALVAFAAAVPAGLVPHKTCRVEKAFFNNGEKILSPLPHTQLGADELPTEWFWGNVSGRNYLSIIRQQHEPVYCGSCWAHGPTSSLSDRLRIARHNVDEINLSPQAVINAEIAGSCEGGNPGPVYEYAHDEGLAEDTCQLYTATDPTSAKAQTDLGQCEVCVPNKGATPLPGTCSPVTNYTRWKVSEYGSVSGADKMKAEIYKRGPISCGIAVTDKFEAYTSGIYSEFTILAMINHELAVVGWGVENGVEYWIGRNSWGSNWGENGFFRIQMHSHNLKIETDCTWGVPLPEGVQKVLPTPVAADPKPVFKHHNPDHPCHISAPGPRPQHVISPLPHTYIRSEDLPVSFDIRNVSGVNYASPAVSQHINHYCGSCWAMSSAAALSDRFNLARKDVFPEIKLAPQVLVNCVTGNYSKGCSGGQPDSAYEWILTNGGLVDETCMNFQSVDMTCVPENICRDCAPGKGCWAKTDYKTYKIKEHGWVTGEHEMMAEILARGPVACSIAVTPELDNFVGGGVFTDTTGARGDDHDVAISGWGEENGVKYWLIRNSWGTWWADRGWFKLARGINNLGVETQGCAWAVPQL